MGPGTSTLTDRARRTLNALASAIMPAGRIFPGAGTASVTKLEGFLADLPAAMQRGYYGLLGALDGHALLRHRRRFADLEVAEQLGLLEWWGTGGVGRRTALRALVTPLKVAHYDDPGLYKHVGCVYDFGAAAREVKPAYFRDRVHPVEQLDGDLSVECDVVVIGTGAGGAVVAKELAEAGLAVVMVEEGRYFDRADFKGRPYEMQRQMYRNGGATFSVGNVAIPIPLGRTVGGTTTINSGTCYRVPDRIVNEWNHDLGLTEMTPEHLAPYFDRVERVLQVAPARAAFLGGNARVIARGCEKLGFVHKPLRRNAPDCDGQGVCCFGCPTDAKRSTNVSYVPMALRAGAELFTGAAVDRIIVADGRATGVVARGASGRTLTIHARAVVVSCGALLTPGLLERNGLAGVSGQLGGNLSIHPAAAVLAQFDERIATWEGIPQGYAIEEFHEEGLLFEGVSTPLEFAMSVVPFVGPRLTALAEGFEHLATFGFMVEDTSRGRVRSVAGRPVVTYVLGDGDVARIKRGAEILARVFFAAGARSVLLPVHGFEEIRGEDDLARLRRTRIRASDLDLSAYHPLGTARMGPDPATSVVDANNRHHQVEGLYVVDGASVPSSLGVNPMVTIMALATRASERIAQALD